MSQILQFQSSYLSPEINAVSTGNTDCFVLTVTSPVQYYPTSMLVIPTDFQNILAGPTINVGFDPSNYNNIVSSKSVGGLLGSLRALQLETDIPFVADPGETIKCKVVTAATGIGVVCKFKLLMDGYFVIL